MVWGTRKKGSLDGIKVEDLIKNLRVTKENRCQGGPAQRSEGQISGAASWGIRETTTQLRPMRREERDFEIEKSHFYFSKSGGLSYVQLCGGWG